MWRKGGSAKKYPDYWQDLACMRAVVLVLVVLVATAAASVAVVVPVLAEQDLFSYLDLAINSGAF